MSDCDLMDSIAHQFLFPWNSPGKNTGAGGHFHLQIFPTQGSNLSLMPPTLPGGFFTTNTQGMAGIT